MKPRGVTYKLNLEGGAKQSINKKKKHAKTRVLRLKHEKNAIIVQKRVFLGKNTYFCAKPHVFVQNRAFLPIFGRKSTI